MATVITKARFVRPPPPGETEDWLLILIIIAFIALAIGAHA